MLSLSASVSAPSNSLHSSRSSCRSRWHNAAGNIALVISNVRCACNALLLCQLRCLAIASLRISFGIQR